MIPSVKVDFMIRNLTEISKELNRLSGFKDLPSLIYMTDSDIHQHPESIIGKMPGGSMVIFRDYDHEKRYELGMALRYICKSRKIKFLVAGDIALSLLLDADGIHFPEFMLQEAHNIRSEHPNLFLSVAAHNELTVKTAHEIGMDAVLLAPIFSTDSHPETHDDKNLTIGIEKLTTFCKNTEIPIYALGGINHQNAIDLLRSGVAGIAAIRGLEAEVGTQDK